MNTELSKLPHILPYTDITRLLKGPPGERGSPGVPGSQGAAGMDGADGQDGLNGTCQCDTG